MADQPFWETKSFAQMSAAEWESLCDGCGRCCLHKLQPAGEETVTYTKVACRLLDSQSCRCTDYSRRTKKVPACLVLSPDNVHSINWLPASCAYVRLRENRGLADWHPLVSGSAESVHEAGVSVRGKVVSEAHVHPDDPGALLMEFPLD